MMGMARVLRRMELVGVTCAVLTAGCVKRTETITVRQDGSVEIRLEYEGDRKDMESGAPALVQAPGWEFAEKLTKNDKNEEKITRTAAAIFAPGKRLPAMYPVDDPQALNLAVRHPTTLTVETSGSDIYYHFRRVYKSRSWAYVKDWERILIEEPLARGGDVSLEELSPVKKQELVQNIIHFEAVKQLAFARRAALSVQPPLAQDDWLQLRQAIMDTVETVDTDHVLELLEARYEQTEDGADQLTELADQLKGQITGVIQPTLRQLGLRRRYVAVLEDAFDRERRTFAITEDYQDDQWEITVGMPGKIVGHNGDSIEGNEVKWEFDGRRFFDRDYELMVSSKVSAATGR